MLQKWRKFKVSSSVFIISLHLDKLLLRKWALCLVKGASNCSSTIMVVLKYFHQIYIQVLFFFLLMPVKFIYLVIYKLTVDYFYIQMVICAPLLPPAPVKTVWYHALNLTHLNCHIMSNVAKICIKLKFVIQPEKRNTRFSREN